ncbi:hypothetical protein, partial [Acinetobacter baumannii]|uniref:hypothetical protein n=1 Tax=Acinetobacter baumannii TaxID=470 RepID=UPI00331BA625
ENKLKHLVCFFLGFDDDDDDDDIIKLFHLCFDLRDQVTMNGEEREKRGERDGIGGERDQEERK